MKLTHARDDRLPGLLVDPDLKGRVFFGELLQRLGQFVLVRFRARLDRHVNHRFRKVHAHQFHGLGRVAQRIAGDRVLGPDYGANIARAQLIQIRTLIRVHLQQPAQPFLPAGPRVQDLLARFDHPRVDPDEGQAAHVRIGQDLKRQGRKRVIIRWMPDDFLLRIARFVPHHRRHIRGRRQIVHNGVQKQARSLVLQGRTAEYGAETAVDRAFAQAGEQFLHGDGLLMDVLLHHPFVRFRRGFQDIVTRRFGLRKQFRRNLRNHLLAFGPFASPRYQPHSDKIDNPAKVRFTAHGHLKRHRMRTEPHPHALHRVVEVRPYTIHLVYESNPGDSIPQRLAPDRLRLRLHACYRAKHRHGPVEHTKTPFNLRGEIHVAGRVNDIDPMPLPRTRGRCRHDRDAPLALLGHKVHRRGPVMDFPHTMNPARVEQNSLGHGRLARVDVRGNADVTSLFQCKTPRHWTPFEEL